MPTLTLEQAQTMIETAIRRAAHLDLRVAVAVVDPGAHLVAFARMDGTQHGSVKVALAKAECACAFRRPTKVWEERVAHEKPGYATLPGVVAVEGGLALFAGDELIGAVGVSGARSDQDGDIAQAAIATLHGGAKP